MRVVILGCGRTGSMIASSLAAEGDRVIIIDQDHTQFERVAPSLIDEGVVALIEGDGTLSETLIRSDIEDTDLFIALTGQDTVNALAAQKVKRIYEVDQVILRVRDPSLAALYSALDLDVYCPTESAVSFIMETISREG